MKRFAIRSARICFGIAVLFASFFMIEYGGEMMWKTAVGVAGVGALVWSWEIAFGSGPPPTQ